jgi:hypothetical protein
MKFFVILMIFIAAATSKASVVYVLDCAKEGLRIVIKQESTSASKQSVFKAKISSLPGAFPVKFHQESNNEIYSAKNFKLSVSNGETATINTVIKGKKTDGKLKCTEVWPPEEQPGHRFICKKAPCPGH